MDGFSDVKKEKKHSNKVLALENMKNKLFKNMNPKKKKKKTSGGGTGGPPNVSGHFVVNHSNNMCGSGNVSGSSSAMSSLTNNYIANKRQIMHLQHDPILQVISFMVLNYSYCDQFIISKGTEHHKNCYVRNLYSIFLISLLFLFYTRVC